MPFFNAINLKGEKNKGKRKRKNTPGVFQSCPIPEIVINKRTLVKEFGEIMEHNVL